MAMLSGLTMLIVEDEAIVAVNLEWILTDLGCEVHVALTLEETFELIARHDFDCVVLDININGEHSHDAADLLSLKQVPFMYTSGNEWNQLFRPQDEGRVHLVKPYTSYDVVKILRHMNIGLHDDVLNIGCVSENSQR